MPSFALPSQDVVWTAVVTMTNEDTDPDYAVENLQDNDPANTARSTTTSTTVTVTLAAPVTIRAAAFFNANATSASLQNDAGLNQAFAIPARTADGKPINAWLDIGAISNRTDDVWRFVFAKTGSAVQEVGRVCLVSDLNEIEIVWGGAGPSPEITVKRPGAVEHRTRLGTSLRRASPVAAPRTWAGTVIIDSFLAILQTLEQETNGLARGFLWLYDEDANDAAFAQFARDDWQYTPELPGVTTMKVIIEEIPMGLPPSLA